MLEDATRKLKAELEAAEHATDRGLALFRRIREFGLFGGTFEGALTRQSTVVVDTRNAVLSGVEAVTKLLLHTKDRDGIFLDFERPIYDRAGAIQKLGIGERGGRLCAALGEFLGGLGQEDASRCVQGLEAIRGHLERIRNDTNDRVDPGTLASAPREFNLWEKTDAGWRITFDSKTHDYPDRLGLRDLASLIQQPHQSVWAYELTGRRASGGPRPDPQAQRRAMKAVSKRIGQAKELIRKRDIKLWRYLERHVETGIQCVYSPAESSHKWVVTT